MVHLEFPGRVGLLLSVMALTLTGPMAALSQTDDIDPNTFDWAPVTDTVSFYLVDSNNSGYWCTKKYVAASTNLISSHCKTGADHLISHYHFESDFSPTQQADADRYWDWYYQPGYPQISRMYSATLTRDSLAWIMDGYATNANYDYWLIHDTTSNQIFTDDCYKRNGQPATSFSTNDRVVYIDNGVYELGKRIEWKDIKWPFPLPPSPSYHVHSSWKCGYSGVYQHIDTDDDSILRTPCRVGTNYVSDYWDPNTADVYYKK